MKRTFRSLIVIFGFTICVCWYFIHGSGIVCAAAEASVLEIVKQPEDLHGIAGALVSTKVEAAGEGLTYQWWVSTSERSKFYPSSITTETYKTRMTEDRDGRRVYCVITDTNGNVKITDTVVFRCKKIEIIKQPEDICGFVEDLVSASVEATGEDLTYQWWVSTSGNGKFYRSAITTSVYKTKMTSDKEGRRIYCVIADSSGNVITTDTVSFSCRKFEITKQPEDLYGRVGDLISTSVEADGKDLTYQWWVTGSDKNKFYRSAITESTYKTRMTADKVGRKVYCTVKDANGNIQRTNIVTIHDSAECDQHVFAEEILEGKTKEGYRFKQVCERCQTVDYVYYDALITFVDDDAKADALVHWERIMDATGIQVTSAIIPGKVTETTQYKGYYSYAGWDMIHRLQKKGMDFVNHTYNHKNLTKLTADEMRKDFEKAKAVLKEKGIDSEILVYPNTAYNDTVLAVVSEYFSMGVTCGGILNDAPFDNVYTVNRVNINDNSNVKSIDFGTSTVECQGIRALEDLKGYVNKAVEKDAWLIFMTHAYDSPAGKTYFDVECENTIIDLCRYMRKLGNVKVITLTEGSRLISKK